MRNPRMNGALVAFAVIFGLAALTLPLAGIELLGVGLVVAGAYFGGVRGGLVTALWAVFVATVGYFVLASGDLTAFIFSLIAYGAVGVGLGVGVDRFVAQRRRLEDVAERAEAARRQLKGSQARYRLLFEVSNDAVYLHGLDAGGEPTRFMAVNDAACKLLGYTREEMLGLTPRAVETPARPGQLREIMQRLLKEERVVYESVRQTRDGRRVPVEMGSSLTDVDGELLVLSISRDITGRKKAERQLGAHPARRAHRSAQPARFLRDAPRAEQAGQAGRQPFCWCSTATLTASRPSTTDSAMGRATRCCRPSPQLCAARFATPTCWRVSGATSSA